tara:strand:- start:645 stop:809 length:165 start_codon:yes stop_codon:yes gene_type:complete
MKRYRVTAIQPAIYEIIVESNSKEEAIKIADETDEGWNLCTYLDWSDYQAEEKA